MTASISALRLPDQPSLSEELDLASQLFHRINRIIPPDQNLVTVTPDCPAREAVVLMQRRGYSQVPVVKDEQFFGIFSYRSFAREAARITFEELRADKSAPGDLRVDECLETFEFARKKEEIDRVFDWMDRDNGVLVGTSEQLVGILAPMDVLRYLHRVASPFVLLSEIELALRNLIKRALDSQQIAEAAERCLASVYPKEHIPHTLEKMSFDNYRSIISSGQYWEAFEPLLGGTRTRTIGKLKEIGELRNDLFHFRRELTEENRQTLSRFRHWFLSKIEQAELRSRGELPA